MHPQAAKSLRAALPGYADADSFDRAAMQAATDYVFSEDRAHQDDTLIRLDLLDVLQRAVIDGDTLEAIGADGPYGNTAQRRAWAAGRLAAACYGLMLADRVHGQRRADAATIAGLEKQVDYLRAETRAAARFGTIDVPFRKPKPTGDFVHLA